MMIATERAQTLDTVKFQPISNSAEKDSSTAAAAYSFYLYKSNIGNTWE